MKALKRVLALFGIVTGVGALLLGASTWWFISRGPFPDGVIYTGRAEIPFAWSSGVTWSAYAVVATLAVSGLALMVVSYRSDFRRPTAEAAANGGPAALPLSREPPMTHHW